MNHPRFNYQGKGISRHTNKSNFNEENDAFNWSVVMVTKKFNVNSETVLLLSNII